MIVFTLICFVKANGQSKKWKLEVGVGHVNKFDGSSGANILTYLEPRFCLTPRLNINARYELSFISIYSNDGNGDWRISGNSAYTLNAQYFLHTEVFKAFVGGGLGIFRIHMLNDSNKKVSVLGAYPRIGVEKGKFVISTQFNLLPGSKEVSQPAGAFLPSVTYSRRNSYWGIQFGFIIGRG
jgi:hypothetical protein